jgi:hypothetical protein
MEVVMTSKRSERRLQAAPLVAGNGLIDRRPLLEPAPMVANAPAV